MNYVTSWWNGPPQPTVNELASNTNQTTRAMETKVNFLKKKIAAVEAEAKEAHELGDVVTRDAKIIEMQELQREHENISAMLNNTKSTRVALDQAVLNKSVYETQQGAVVALNKVNANVSIHDIDRVTSQLETEMDQVDHTSQIMSKPLHRHGRTKATTQNSISNVVAGWDTAKMPTVQSPQATTSVRTTTNMRSTPLQNSNSNN